MMISLFQKTQTPKFFNLHEWSLRGNSAAGLLFLALLISTTVAFWPALQGPFLFDDFPNLQNLAALQGNPTWENVRFYLYSFIDNPGRPLSALSFLIEDAAWPSDPRAFKRDNLLFHLLAGCLLFCLSLKLAGLNARTAAKASWIAVTATGLWLLHPMQLSATMLVVQRMNILSTIFTVLGLIIYVSILSNDRHTPLLRVAIAGLALGFAALTAFLCKENGVLVFAYASVINAALLSERIHKLPPRVGHLLVWGAALPIILLALLALLNIDKLAQDYWLRDFSMGERLLTQARVMWSYLQAISFPRLAGQGIYHDDYEVSRGLLAPITTLPAVLGVLALIGYAVLARKTWPLTAFSVLWFFAGHLMESTLIGLELYFEHRNYLPMFGLLFGVATLPFLAPKRWQTLAGAALALWLLIATLLTAYNARIWGDHRQLAIAWITDRPKSPRAIQELAGVEFGSGDLQSARTTLRLGMERLPQNTELELQYLLTYCTHEGLNQDRKQRLLSLLREITYVRVVANIATQLVTEAIKGGCGKTLTRAEAAGMLDTLLRNSAYKDGDSQGFLHYEAARLSLVDRDLDRLMHHLDRSYDARPNPLVAREQAIYLLAAGLPKEALGYLDRSERTPLPKFKLWLLDMRRRNAPLRASAERMLAETTSRL